MKNKISTKIINKKIKYTNLKSGRVKYKRRKIKSEPFVPYKIGERWGDDKVKVITASLLGMKSEDEQKFPEKATEFPPETREEVICLTDGKDYDVYKAKIERPNKYKVQEIKIWKPGSRRKATVMAAEIMSEKDVPDELVRCMLINHASLWEIV